MSFLSNQELEKLLAESIVPYALGNIKNAAYELSLGNEFFATNSPKGVRKIIKRGEQITINPGQCALLLTKETVTIPNNLIALISIKATFKFRGLVNVSGFHVDPGFHGKIMFAVYNAGSQDVVLTEGQRLFLIWFCELSTPLKEKDVYNGKSNNRRSITSEDVMRIHGDIYSPNVLYNLIKELENTKVKELDKNLSDKVKSLEKDVSDMVKDLNRTVTEKVNDLEQKVSNKQTTLTVLVTISLAILALMIGKCVDSRSNDANYRIIEKQAQLETNINSLSEKINSQSNSVTETQQRLNKLEINANSSVNR